MKMVSGDLSARSLGTRCPSVSVATRCSSLGVKSSRRTKWSMTLCSCASAIKALSLALTLRPSGRAGMLERGHRDGGEPYLRPRQRRRGKERDRLAAEDLVADRLVEQIVARQADRVPFALVQDALGLEEQRLAEALGSDDDELVVAGGREEAVDLGRPVEQGLVEVLRDADVVGVHRPRSHWVPRAGCLSWPRIAQSKNKGPAARLTLCSVGRPCRDRTCDQRIKSPLLYQLS